MTQAYAASHLSCLDEYLTECYTPDELIRLVERLFGAALIADLPNGSGTRRDFVFHAVRTLARRGLLDSRLIRALLRERPNRANELRGISRKLAIPIDDEDGDAETLIWREVDSARTRRQWVEELEQHLVARERLLLGDPARAKLDARIDGLARKLRKGPAYVAGSVVAGTRLDGVLGVGNFGTVWRAHQLDTGRVVATKIFDLDRLTDGVKLWRFRRSIHALRVLNRRRRVPPSIPALMGEAEDSLAFVMPCFTMGTLERVDRHGWSLDTKLDVFIHICRAVEFAHACGVIHRDIKPSNIVLNEDSRPVLVDYDIADIDFVTELATAQGGLGTPVFAAPEQLESADLADERSDIYSLGRLLHYLLLERSPGYQIDRDPELENLRGHHPALIAAIRRATQLDPKRRYDSVTRLIADVERYKTGLAAVQARMANGRRWVRRNASLLTTCLTLTLSSTTVAILQGRVAEERQRAIDNARHRLDLLEEALQGLNEARLQFQDLKASVVEFDEEFRRFQDEVEASSADDHLIGLATKNAARFRALAEKLSLVGEELNRSAVDLDEQQTALRASLANAEQPAPPPEGDSSPRVASAPAPPTAPRRLSPPSVPPHGALAMDLMKSAPETVLVPTERQEPTATKSERASRRPPRKRSTRHTTVPHRDLDGVKRVLQPQDRRIAACVKDNRFEDRSARLLLRLVIGRSGKVVRWKPSRALMDSTRSCIDKIIEAAEFGPAARRDRYEQVVFK